MTISGTSSDAPVWGIHEYVLARLIASACSMPMARPAMTVGTRYWKLPDQRGGQRRDHEQRVADRRQRADRGDEDAGEAGDRGADHPVHEGHAVRRDAADEGTGLRLGRGPGEEAEAGVAEDQAEDDRDHDDGHGQVEAVRQDRQRAPLPAPGREDRLHRHRRGAHGDRHDALDHDHDAQRRHRPSERRSVAQWSEHHEVEHGAEQRRDQQGDDRGGERTPSCRRGRRTSGARAGTAASRPCAATRRCTPRTWRWRRWRS